MDITKEKKEGYYKGKEDGYYKGKEDGKIESDLTTWMRLFKNNISIKDNGNLYPDIGKVAENTVQKLFSGDPYLETFLYFLKNNDKILNN
jgi:flagellar biosynthesis/type III secretory pathway protein FliH